MTAQGSILRVLVVDDERDNADSLGLLVGLWGYEVRCSYNGSALPLAEEFRPDVIVLDIAMPKLDGNSMARYLRQQEAFRDALLIAVSGYHDEAVRQLSVEAGFDHYLVKPIDVRALEKLLLAKAHLKRLQGPT
jgi:CheY-like chemotaxis protein